MLLKIQEYPKRKHPDINIPTLSVGTLNNGQYQWQTFTGNERIISSIFPELELSVDRLVAASQLRKR